MKKRISLFLFLGVSALVGTARADMDLPVTKENRGKVIIYWQGYFPDIAKPVDSETAQTSFIAKDGVQLGKLYELGLGTDGQIYWRDKQ